MRYNWYKYWHGILISFFITDIALGYYKTNLTVGLWKLSFAAHYDQDADNARYHVPYWLGSQRHHLSVSGFGFSFSVVWGWPEKRFIDCFSAPSRNKPRPTYADLLEKIEKLKAEIAKLKGEL